jgi:undecaprenyl diphosphate synthase
MSDLGTELGLPAKKPLPRHVAIIMDGNGRWAEERGYPRIEGHRVGAESVRDVVRAARQIGLEAITLYAFSAQNWHRPAAEVAALMQLLRDYLVGERAEIMDNQIRLTAIGDLTRLPDLVKKPLADLIHDSRDNRGMTLTLALSYGGRESIAAAARRAAERVERGELRADAVSIDLINSELPTRELPALDLLIRTSGEFRISNFLLWEAAYAELYFTDVPWPDFRRRDFFIAIEDYAKRERRFGLTTDQLLASG